MECDRIETIETISTLTERLQTSTLLNDRRDACRSLRSLARDYRVEVGAQAMEPMLQAIKNDGYDAEIVENCLISLNYIISGHLADRAAATWSESEQAEMDIRTNLPHTSNQQPSIVNHDPGRELAEIFLKKAENLNIVLEQSRDTSDKIRWVVVRILCGLVRQKLELVQDYILSEPMTLTHLTQLISDKHEGIRNDTLVLFVQLTQTTNQNISNVLAYDCFDKIISRIELEGFLTGTIAVVNDCLNILLNLIQYNELNQILFRESGHLQKLEAFFDNIRVIEWDHERINCIVLVLQIIDSMLGSQRDGPCTSNNSNYDESVRRCQEVLQRPSGLLDKLCELLTVSSLPIVVLSETMNTVSDIVRGNLGRYATKVMPTNSMMPILLLTMVKEMCQDQEKRISELYSYMQVLHSFVSKST